MTLAFRFIFIGSFLACIPSCSSGPKEELSEEELKKYELNTSTDTPTAPKPPCDSNAIEGLTYSPVKWEEQAMELNDEEKRLIGCWVAEVNEVSVKTGTQLLISGERLKNPHIINTIVKEDKNKENCIWLTLNENHHGFWSHCLNTEDQIIELFAAESNSLLNESAGFYFDWYYKDSTIHIQFPKCMTVPYIQKKKDLGNIKVKYWNIKLANRSYKVYEAEEYFPEYNYTLPEKNIFNFSKPHRGYSNINSVIKKINN